MAVTLKVQAQGLSDEELMDLTRELCNDLNQEPEVKAKLAEAPAGPGARADAVLLTHIMMQAASLSGEVLKHSVEILVAEKLVALLKTYFERYPALRAIVQDREGGKVELSRESVQPNKVEQAVKEISKKLNA